jgi:hypothetical protein
VVALPVGVIGFFWLINGTAEFITRKAFGLLGEKPIEAAFGVLMFGGAGWGIWRMVTGHAPPETTRLEMLRAVVVLVGIAGLGLLFLIDTFADG